MASSLRRHIMMQQGGGGHLPDEYQQVEWLEASGTQYLLLPIVRTSRYQHERVHVKAIWNGTLSSGSESVFCGYGVYQQYYSCLTITTNGITGALSKGGSVVNMATSSAGVLLDYEYEYVDRSFTFNGLTSTTEYYQPHEGDKFGVMTRYPVPGSIHGWRGKYISLERWIDNVKVFDLVPCYRKSDNVPGMYDLVNREFHTNAGTGSFIVGPDV